MKMIGLFITISMLTACQATAQPEVVTCPLTKIDTRAQTEQCLQYKAMPQTEAVKQKMLAIDCGMFF